MRKLITAMLVAMVMIVGVNAEEFKANDTDKATKIISNVSDVVGFSGLSVLLSDSKEQSIACPTTRENYNLVLKHSETIKFTIDGTTLNRWKNIPTQVKDICRPTGLELYVELDRQFNEAFEANDTEDDDTNGLW